jgi:prophage regulatory protein
MPGSAAKETPPPQSKAASRVTPLRRTSSNYLPPQKRARYYLCPVGRSRHRIRPAGNQAAGIREHSIERRPWQRRGCILFFTLSQKRLRTIMCPRRGGASMDGFLRLPPVKATTGLSKASLYRLMDEGLFPRPYSLGARAVGWLASEVQGWIESRRSIGPKNAAALESTAPVAKPRGRPRKALPQAASEQLARARSGATKPAATAVAEPPAPRMVHVPSGPEPQGLAQVSPAGNEAAHTK